MASRRRFLTSLFGAGVLARAKGRAAPTSFPRRESSVLASLRAGERATAALFDGSAARRLAPAQARPPLSQRFSDLPRHFVFEYYPWYRTDPWFHWNQWD